MPRLTDLITNAKQTRHVEDMFKGLRMEAADDTTKPAKELVDCVTQFEALYFRQPQDVMRSHKQDTLLELQQILTEL